MTVPAAQRLLRRVQWSDRRYKGTRCLVFTGATAGGYGRIRDDSGRMDGTHRVLYEAWFGPIPSGMHLDHLCENPPCCNPAHLEPVTHRVNSQRWATGRTHCARGHELTDDNVYTPPDAPSHYRDCRACKRDRDARRRERRRNGDT